MVVQCGGVWKVFLTQAACRKLPIKHQNNADRRSSNSILSGHDHYSANASQLSSPRTLILTRDGLCAKAFELILIQDASPGNDTCTYPYEVGLVQIDSSRRVELTKSKLRDFTSMSRRPLAGH